MCGRQLPAVQQAPAQPQYQQPMYPAGPAPVQPQYQQQPYQQPQYQQAPQPAQYQQQPYQQAQYQQPAAQQQVPQPMTQQPGKPKKNMMLIAILAIVAVVIVVIAIVLLMRGGGSPSVSLTVTNVNDNLVDYSHWALNGGFVEVSVTVENTGTITTTGTVTAKVVIANSWPLSGGTYTGTESVASLTPGSLTTVVVDVTIPMIQAALMEVNAPTVTATVS
jgi:hypothetical protein